MTTPIKRHNYYYDLKKFQCLVIVKDRQGKKEIFGFNKFRMARKFMRELNKMKVEYIYTAREGLDE